MRNKVGEDGRSDHYKGRTTRHEHRNEVALPAKTMSNRPSQVSRNRSGEGEMQMINYSDSGDGRARKVVKEKYMKEVEGKRKSISSGTKEELNAA